MDAPLKVTSACYVSDVTDHTAPMVFAILKQIVTLAKQTVPELKYIHYLSDSPSSQYRNKHLMYIIAQHDKMFGIPCTWTYFESGHGKGPCDGIGGSSKRLADLAVKTDKASIRCAQDFADWGNKSSKKVQYSVVSQSDYIVAKNEINLFNAKPELYSFCEPCPYSICLERVARYGSGRDNVRGSVGAMNAELSRPDLLATVQLVRKQA